jgi:hypothetical protein
MEGPAGDIFAEHSRGAAHLDGSDLGSGDSVIPCWTSGAVEGMVRGLTLPIQDSYSSKEAWIALVSIAATARHIQTLFGRHGFDPD